MANIVFAFDKQTARSRDADGRMRVRDCILSTAEINPYRGAEIPKRDELGLRPDRVYELYRDPEELGSPEALASFQGIPLMIKHIAQTAEQPRKEYQAGSVHSVRFDGKHLRGDLLVSDGHAIDLIESDSLADLSCGYRYIPVMQPGKANGESYDGRMTQIRGNHVALVDEGRATDAHVADSAFVDPRGPNPTMNGDSNMAFPEGNNAAPAAGAEQPGEAAGGEMTQLLALMKQMIEQNTAAHQAILAKLGGGEAGDNEMRDPNAPSGVEGVERPTHPEAPRPEAQDMELEIGHQGPKGKDHARDHEGAMDNEEHDEGEERERREEAEGARDAENGMEPNGETPQPTANKQDGYGARGGPTPFGAMDAKTVKSRIDAAVDAALKAERRRNRDANDAKREVAHVLGGDIALDNAGEIYREALTQVGVDAASVPRGAERAAWQGYKAASARVAGVLPGAGGSMAMDSAPSNAVRSGLAANVARIKVKG